MKINEMRENPAARPWMWLAAIALLETLVNINSGTMNSEGIDAAIEFDESYPAMPPTAGNRALLAQLNEINAALGLKQMAELGSADEAHGVAYRASFQRILSASQGASRH